MPSRRRLAIAVFATLAATGALAVAGSGGPVDSHGQAAAAAQSRPNVVVIESDDQTVESMRVMNRVNSLIGDKGATFQNNFVNFSLCCPSRATFLTGQYAHNHKVVDNAPPDGGFPKFEPLHGNNNLAVWLHNAGYDTAMIGKYLSYMKPSTVPPGWSDWHAVVQGSETVYGYTMNDNGTLTNHGEKPTDFLDDVLTSKAVSYIHRTAPKPNPFFLWLTYTAPHVSGPDPNPNPPYDCDGASKPAPRNAHAFDTEPLPRPPNFNEADVSDKPAAIRGHPVMNATQIANTQRHYRCALESVLAVDRGVQDVVDVLNDTGQLANTLVVFTSDNGFLNGEHRLFLVKRHIYEQSIRVPLEMRGPGIPPGVTVGDLSINADLAPTILDVDGSERRRRHGWALADPVRATAGCRAGARAVDRGADLRGDPDRALHVRRVRQRREGALRPAEGPVGAPEPGRQPRLRIGPGAARERSSPAPELRRIELPHPPGPEPRPP